jgi:hypothetical protein
MAPVAIRQSHSLGLGIPRPPKRPPNTPVKVDKSIDPKVFAELFAGTVVIFILAVLFWKLGKFIRRFSRKKVLRASKPTNTRYARTWYGWVSATTHEKNKKIFCDFFRQIWNSMAWKSTRADYSWVWWDPGDIERQKRQREKGGLWWLPECFKSYEDFPTADEIWNPCARPQCQGSLRTELSTPQAVPLPDNMERPPAHKITRSILEEIDRDPMEASNNSSNHHSHFHFSKTKTPEIRAPVIRPNLQSLPSRQRRSFQARDSIPRSRDGVTQNFSCQFGSIEHHTDCQYETAKKKDKLRTKDVTSSHRHSYSHGYRGWSARMQLGPRGAVFENQRDSSGPPGTPKTEMLASYVSDQSSSFRGHLKQKSNNREHLHISEDEISFASKFSVGNQVLGGNKGLKCSRTIQWNSAPARSHPQANGALAASRPTLYDGWQSTYDPKHPSLSRRKGKSPESNPLRISSDQIQLKPGSAVEDLSDWEIRMLEKLDRKLVWIFNEYTPGQKPYQFAMLANHWINRETWIVYDPISRVPMDARRKWGDPRFNVPYPQPILSPRPKYPVSQRKRAHNPRIDSWRAAANQQRKVSGIREAIRTITLYEESAEEPPDGHIDPACWSLPKPPQGFEMSTAQQNAWYEGGAGWQETLSDWQRVHRGYRVHKAIHEGRANRGKVKEVAAQINESCRTVSGKLIPNFDVAKSRTSTPLVS